MNENVLIRKALKGAICKAHSQQISFISPSRYKAYCPSCKDFDKDEVEDAQECIRTLFTMKLSRLQIRILKTEQYLLNFFVIKEIPMPKLRLLYRPLPIDRLRSDFIQQKINLHSFLD